MSIPVTDSNIFFPGGPYNGATGNGLAWSIDSGGAAATCACPNYFKFNLNMPANGSATLNFNTVSSSQTQSGQVFYNGWLKVFVDNVPAVQTEITGTTSLSVISSATAGIHNFVVWLMGVNNRQWSNPANEQAFSLTSITAAGSTTSPVTPLNYTLFAIGDSRDCGYNNLGNGNNPNSDFSVSYAAMIANALGCELCAHVYPSLGYISTIFNGGTGWPTNTYCPPALYIPGQPGNSSWNQIYNGQSRVFPSAITNSTTRGLDYVLVPSYGINDSFSASVTGATPSTLTAGIADFYPVLRAAIPAATKIVVGPSVAGGPSLFGNTNFPTSASLINATLAGFSAYQAASRDPQFYVISADLTPWEVAEFFGYPTPGVTAYCSDGLHPWGFAHGILGHKLLRSIDQMLGCPVPGSYTSFGRSA